MCVGGGRCCQTRHGAGRVEASRRLGPIIEKQSGGMCFDRLGSRPVTRQKTPLCAPRCLARHTREQRELPAPREATLKRILTLKEATAVRSGYQHQRQTQQCWLYKGSREVDPPEKE